MAGCALAIAFTLAAGLVAAGLAQSAYAAGLTALEVSAQAAKNPINRADTQTISVKVTDNSSNPVKDALVQAVVFDAGKRETTTFTGLTDSDGMFSFDYRVDSAGKSGLAGVDVKASKEGYDNGYDSAFYRVFAKR